MINLEKRVALVTGAASAGGIGFAPARLLTGQRASAEVFNRTVAAIPMGRMGEPDDIAAMIAFLASDDPKQHRCRIRGRWWPGRPMTRGVKARDPQLRRLTDG